MSNEKSSQILSALLGAAIGAIATILTSGFGYLSKDRELDIRMMEIGLSILNGDKTEKSKPARQFAVDLLEKYSGVEISQKKEWAETGDVPYQAVPIAARMEFSKTFSPNSPPWQQVTSFFVLRYNHDPTSFFKLKVRDLSFFNHGADENIRKVLAQKVALELVNWLMQNNTAFKEGMDKKQVIDDLSSTLSDGSQPVHEIVKVVEKSFIFQLKPE